VPNSAYSAAKFAVRGFSEGLIEDLRAHAPQVRVAVVLPGHVGTDIIANSLRARGLPEPADMSDAQLDQVIPSGARPEGLSGDDLRALLAQANAGFRDQAPLSAADAAAIILDGVRAGDWRILVGQDARLLDQLVRAKPEAAYDWDYLASATAPGAAAPGPAEPGPAAPEPAQ
jgi:short-subunit dehydrogenase